MASVWSPTTDCVASLGDDRRYEPRSGHEQHSDDPDRDGERRDATGNNPRESRVGAMGDREQDERSDSPERNGSTPINTIAPPTMSTRRSLVAESIRVSASGAVYVSIRRATPEWAKR